MLLCNLAGYIVAAVLGGVQANIFLFMLPALIFVGSLQAYQKSLFASLIPAGKESAYFALYAISDKGSNILGGAVTGFVHNHSGSYYPAFWYTAVAFVLGALCLWSVDIEEGQAQAKDGVAEDDYAIGGVDEEYEEGDEEEEEDEE